MLSTAAFSETVDGFTHTESRNQIVLLGDTVELDCSYNSSKSFKWYFIRFGHNKSTNINSKSSSKAYGIKSKHDGQVTLIIHDVQSELAGEYVCNDTDTYKLTVEMTVLGKEIFSTSLKQLIHFCY